MRGTLTGVRAAVAAAVVGLAAGPAAAQEWVPGKRFAESATRLFGGVTRVAEKTDFGFTEGVCFLSAFLNKGEDVQFTRDFDGGVKYAVVGGGDDGTKDLDIVITDDAGNEVAKDTLPDNRPVVEFTPPKPGRYTIKLVMHDAGANGGFGTVGVLKAGGFVVPARNQEAAVANLLAACGDVDRRVKERVLFSSGSNRWAVYGAMVRPGADVTVNMAPPGAGRHVWVAAGDTTAEDVDSYLFNSAMKLLAKDELDDARPVLDYRTDAGAAYTLRVKNVRSRGASLLLAATLALD